MAKNNKTESLGLNETTSTVGIVEDLPEAQEQVKRFLETTVKRDDQRRIEQYAEKFGLSEPDDPDDVLGSFQKTIINSGMFQIAGGVSDAARNTLQSLGDLIDLGLPGTGKSVSGVLEKIPDIPESDENSNEILRSAAQYATNFIPLMRGLRIASAIPKMGKTVQSATAGMLTAFSALDVDTPKFGEMIESLHPKLKLPLLDFLKSNPDDSNAEKRFKNSIDDALAFGALGGTFFTIAKFVRGAKFIGRKLNETITKPKVEVPTVSTAAPKGEKVSKATTKKTSTKKLVQVTGDTKKKLKDFLEMKGEDAELVTGELNINFENWKVKGDMTDSLNKVAAVYEKEIRATGRGTKITQEEMIAIRDLSGIGMKQLLETTGKDPLSMQQVKSFIAHIYHINVQMDDAIKLWKAGDKSALDTVEKRFAQLGELVPRFKGGKTATAQSLKSADTIVREFDGGLSIVKDAINKVEEIPLGLTGEELVNSLNMIPTVKGRSIFARAITTGVGMAMEAFIAGLVSGTKTVFGVNTIGNLNMLMFGIAERGFASGTSKIFGAGKNGIAPQEVQYLLYGMINSIDEALQVAGKTLRTGIQASEFSKIDFPRQITSERVDLSFIKNENIQNVFKGGIDALGEFIRLPFRLLGTTDDFFKVINTRGHLWALGARRANSLGLSPDSNEWMSVVKEIIDNPTKALSDQANDFGHIQTLTNTLNKSGSGIIEGFGASVNEFSNNFALAKIVVPFVKIATNITKFSLERTPFAALMKDTQAAIGRGGADAQMAYAKGAIGSMVLALGYVLAEVGVITGTFPTSSVNQRKLKRESGVDQNSFIVGGKSYPYRRIDPSGLLFGMGADISELARTFDIDSLSKLWAVASTVIGENVLNKTYLVGIADIVDAMMGRRSATKVFQRFASTTIPFSSLVREGERFFDPTIGETNPNLPSMWDKFINGFMVGKPGENRYLMPKRGFWGDVLKRERYFDTKNLKNDPALDALIENEVSISFHPDRAISGRKKKFFASPKASDGIVLEDPEYDRLIELFGKVEIGGLVAREAILQLIELPFYKNASVFDKKRLLESTIRQYRTLAEKVMLDEDERSGGHLNEIIRLKKLLERTE